MPLDVGRLRDSDLAANETPEACWAALLLWAASWHQVPAASIPNDDMWIAKAAGYMMRGKIDKAWKDVRGGALRGYILCADGRLYHPVVAEKAAEAWQAKLEQRWRSECGRIKKHNQRHGTTIKIMQFHEWMSAGRPVGQPLDVPGDNEQCPGSVPRETSSKRQGEGQGQGQFNSVPNGTDAGASSPPKAKSPEETAKAELWRIAVQVLQAGGCNSEDVCRSFMGKLVRDYTFPVVQEAVIAAVTAQPADAREYLKAVCQRIKGERLNKQESLEKSNAEVARRLAGESP